MVIPPDIEIAQGAKLKPITEIAAALGLSEDDIEHYDFWPIISFGLAIRFG